ncbi:MAG: Hsp20/alpha crystallin family protein [Promethearchaeota archaeon]
MPEVKPPKKRKGELERIDALVKDLQTRFDEIFGISMGLRSKTRNLWDGDACCLEALGDVQETESEYVVTLDLPMVNKEDVQITTTDRELTVQAKMREEVHYERWGTVQREIRFQSLSKKVSMPRDADADNIKAGFKEGLLEIHIPKRTQKKQVQID